MGGASSVPRIIGGYDARIATLPWSPASYFATVRGGASLDRDELHRDIATHLLEAARGLFAQMGDDRPRILLAHWNVSGAVSSSGADTSIFREVTLPLDELAAIGFDAVVLGHIHRPQILDAERRVFYVGSPMPLNFGEADHPHVAWILDTDAGLMQIPLDFPPLQTIRLRPAIPETFTLVQGATVKVVLRGTEAEVAGVDQAQLRRELLEQGAAKVWSIQTDIERDELVRGVQIDETANTADAFELYFAEEDRTLVEHVRVRHERFVEALS